MQSYRQCRLFLSFFALVVTQFGLVIPASAQPARDGQKVTITIPRFAAFAGALTAEDETGWDWLGSDEVYAIFADFNPIDERASREFGDFDTGETKFFRSDDNCMAPLQDCSRGASKLHFAVSLWEADWDSAEAILGLKYPTLLYSHLTYNEGRAPQDDFIGRVEMNFETAQLVQSLPMIGQTKFIKVHPTGGSGRYLLTYRITRLPNIRKTIVIGPSRPNGISLQITLLQPLSARKVSLTWSGATAPSVDVLRGAALIANTPNDGEYTDHPNSGTYQYRVCNAGSGDCSAAVSVTLP